MLTLENKEALFAIQSWAERSDQAASAKTGPDAKGLCFLLRKRGIHRVSVRSELYNGQRLIEFDIDAPLNMGRKTRYMLPVHFAITRILELIPDVRLCLINKGKKDAPEADKYFYMTIRYPVAFKQAHELRDRNRLERIIFNAPPDAEVGELRGGDYRCIIPSGYVLSKHRGDKKQNAERWLEIARAEFSSPTNPLGEAPEVLHKLLIIAERWHWGELLGRLPDDPRISALRAGLR